MQRGGEGREGELSGSCIKRSYRKKLCPLGSGSAAATAATRRRGPGGGDGGDGGDGDGGGAHAVGGWVGRTAAAALVVALPSLVAVDDAPAM